MLLLPFPICFVKNEKKAITLSAVCGFHCTHTLGCCAPELPWEAKTLVQECCLSCPFCTHTPTHNSVGIRHSFCQSRMLVVTCRQSKIIPLSDWYGRFIKIEDFILKEKISGELDLLRWKHIMEICTFEFEMGINLFIQSFCKRIQLPGL